MSTNMSMAFKDITTNPHIRNAFTVLGKVRIYREEIASEVLGDDDIKKYMPFARLNDIQNEMTGFASNRSRYTESILQFSAWGRSFAELDTIDAALKDVMPGMGYAEFYSYTTIDPDINTPYLIKRYRYQK